MLVSTLSRPAADDFTKPEPRLGIVICPLVLIERAAVVDVAVPATVVVAKYRLPPAFLNVHWDRPAPADSESWGAVEEAMVSPKIFPVEVAIIKEVVVAPKPTIG